MIKRSVLLTLIPMTLTLHGAFVMQKNQSLKKIDEIIEKPTPSQTGVNDTQTEQTEVKPIIQKTEQTEVKPIIQKTETIDNFSNAKIITVNSLVGLKKAVSSVSKKTKIILKNGKYNQSIELKGNKAPVKIIAETKNKVEIQNTITLRGNHISIVGFLFNGKNGNLKNHGDDNKILGCTWDDSKALYWIDSLEGHRLEIAYNTFKNKRNNRYIKYGCTVSVSSMLNDSTPSEYHIHHNYFYNITKGKNSNGYDTLAIFTRKSTAPSDHVYKSSYEGTHHNVLVEYNLFDKCNAEIELMSAKTTGTTIQYNTILNSDGAISLRHGMYQTVQYNYLKGGRGNRIRVMDHNHNINHNYIESDWSKFQYPIEVYESTNNKRAGYEIAKNFKITDNYLIGGDANFNIGRTNSNPGSFNGLFANNTLIHKDAKKTIIYNPHAKINTIEFKNNKYYGNGKISLRGFQKLNKKPSKPSWAKPLSPNQVGAKIY